MNLTTIEIPKEEAKARLAEYQEALKHERNSEDEAIASAYRAAARGLPIIQLTKAITEGGWFENGLPKIAVIRADAKDCWVRVRRDHLIYADNERPDNRGARVGQHTVLVSVSAPNTPWTSGHTIVPLIPPKHRPKRYRLRSFHILWEVEEWSPVPPKDPALLKHIRGDIWAVMATWELTELERMILGVRT